MRIKENKETKSSKLEKKNKKNMIIQIMNRASVKRADSKLFVDSMKSVD